MALDPSSLLAGAGGPVGVPGAGTGAPTAPPGISEAMARAPSVAEEPGLLKALFTLGMGTPGEQNPADKISRLLSQLVSLSDELSKVVSDHPQYFKALRAVLAMVGTKGGPTGQRKGPQTGPSTPPPLAPGTPAGPPSPSGHPVVIE